MNLITYICTGIYHFGDASAYKTRVATLTKEKDEAIEETNKTRNHNKQLVEKYNLEEEFEKFYYCHLSPGAQIRDRTKRYKSRGSKKAVPGKYYSNQF